MEPAQLITKEDIKIGNEFWLYSDAFKVLWKTHISSLHVSYIKFHHFPINEFVKQQELIKKGEGLEWEIFFKKYNKNICIDKFLISDYIKHKNDVYRLGMFLLPTIDTKTKYDLVVSIGKTKEHLCKILIKSLEIEVDNIKKTSKRITNEIKRYSVHDNLHRNTFLSLLSRQIHCENLYKQYKKVFGIDMIKKVELEICVEHIENYKPKELNSYTTKKDK